MLTIKEDTTLVGISELRTHIEQILEESKKSKVLIGKRNKPIAVLLDVEKYRQMEETLDALEDFALAYLAKAREEGSKVSDYIPVEKILQVKKKGV